MALGALGVVDAWHRAVNAGSVADLLEVTSDDVELVGPRGSVRGSQHLAAWLERARLRLEPRRWFCGRDGHVVVEASGRWHDADGTVIGQGVIASALRVEDCLVTSFARHDALDVALASVGLSEADEVSGTA